MKFDFEDDLDDTLNESLYELESFLNEVEFEDPCSELDDFIHEMHVRNVNKNKNPKRELKESKVTSMPELNERKVRIGNCISIADTDDDEIENSISADTEYVVEEVSNKTSSSLSRVNKKQDFHLRHKKENKVSIGPSFEEKEKEEIEEQEELEIGKVVRKDLVLSKSKFSETKEEKFSWSFEALGDSETNNISRKSEKIVLDTNTNRKKKSSNGPKKVAVVPLIFSIIMVVSLVFLVSLSSRGLSIGFVEGKDMYPTLRESKIYLFEEIKDYNSLNYLDIVIYGLDGQSIASRIIGFPGDEITVTRDGIYVNGEKLDANLIGGEYNYIDIIRTHSNENKYTSGDFDYLFYRLESDSNMVFLLGDNHSNSRDSLLYGPVDVTMIKSIVKE